ncbi:hypothetical protein [Flagellimonas olearia]|uniref:Uracil-DNA glycosylase-like domain-containing protein n=1 Tax=Flagellimonas olearia TaxID=552546 RepID=A0A444VM45_9FLAO|nr:hypothetical protein [Allomuricauda olearia]RYC51858.1 hypothetical protein DN53_08190 [Allomuricauda olearia]
MTSEERFFHQLMGKTRALFLKSKTFEKHQDKNWNSAICETPIQISKGLFFGLNWGGNNIGQQTTYPEKHRKRDWQFISHSRKYFREYLNSEIEDLNYSNFCFFRTPKAHQLENTDWELAYPLFKEYVDFINPPWTLMLGKSNYALSQHISSKQEFSVWDDVNKKTVYGYTGILFSKYPLGAVPHPQARISSDARNEIWKTITDRIKEKAFNENN